MTRDAVRFVADLRRLGRFCRTLALFFLALMGVALIWRSAKLGEFALNRDFVIAILAAPAACALLFLLLAGLARAYPIDVTQAGLILVAPFGRSRSVQWNEIVAVDPIDVSGIPYLLLRVTSRRSGYPIPLWLEDLPRFHAVVEEHAGREHALAVALRSAT